MDMGIIACAVIIGLLNQELAEWNNQGLIFPKQFEINYQDESPDVVIPYR